MSFKKYNISYPSTNGEHDIHAYCFVPKVKKIKGIIQIAHGVLESMADYQFTIDFFCEHAYIVAGNDHAGHGKSLNSQQMIGHFGRNGFKPLVYDMHRLTLILKNKYNSENYFLLGHSMGSFLSRAYITKFSDEIKAVILSGTSAGLFTEKYLIRIGNFIEKTYGAENRGFVIGSMLSAFFKIQLENLDKMEDPYYSDPDVKQALMNEPLLDLYMTNSGYANMVRMLKFVNTKACVDAIPKDLPILLLSGKYDPVGNYGRGTRNLYRYLNKNKNDVRYKLYSKSSHSILKEDEKADVCADILAFIEKNLTESDRPKNV